MKHGVTPEMGRIVFSWNKTLWLYAMLVPALVWGIPAASPRTAALTYAIFFLTFCFGHTVGLHRGVIHRAFSFSTFTRRVFAYVFVLIGLGGPLSWIRMHYHRDYWQNHPRCPNYFAYRHSLIQDFFWNLHCAFIPKHPERYGIPRALLRDPWLRWLERTWCWHVLGFGALLWLFLGFEYFATALCLRVSVSILGHWVTGFLSHKYGYRRYGIAGAEEEGTNQWLLGVLSFGEGFHNNHHAHPGSARIGQAWYEVDFGWWLVRCLEMLGIVWKVKDSARENTLKSGARPLVLEELGEEKKIAAVKDLGSVVICRNTTKSGISNI